MIVQFLAVLGNQLYFYVQILNFFTEEKWCPSWILTIVVVKSVANIAKIQNKDKVTNDAYINVALFILQSTEYLVYTNTLSV